MNVPFVDLKAQYETIRFEVAAAIQRVMEATAFAGGAFVAQFEREFADFCGTGHAVGVGSGTAALWHALQAFDIGKGDEVITVPNTFIATAEAISLTGAEPVFVDVDPKSLLMTADNIEGAVTPKTKAIIPVHLFGRMVDMDPIMAVARRHHLYVIEDACQAHGASSRGRRAGSIGDAGCFSFYPGKNLGAYGEGGAVVVNSNEVAGRIRMLRDHGQSEKYYHTAIGWNDRMDGIQAAVLSVKLKYLERWNALRRKHARIYSSLLSTVEAVRVPPEGAEEEQVFHVYALRASSRDELLQYLSSRGIGCAIHYPVPIHLQKAYEFLSLRAGTLPVAEQSAKELISLPMFAELRGDQIRAVVRGVRDFCSRPKERDGTMRLPSVANARP